MYREIDGVSRAVFVRRLRREYEDGATMLELAARYAMAHDTVRRMLREAGARSRPPKRRPVGGSPR